MQLQGLQEGHDPVGGFNVFPRNIEEAIYEHPGVAEVTVIGIPDAYRGQSAKTFIALGSPRKMIRRNLKPQFSSRSQGNRPEDARRLAGVRYRASTTGKHRGALLDEMRHSFLEIF